MDEAQTKKFVELWNSSNGFNNHSDVGRMTYQEPGVVSWNEYDAPVMDISEVIHIREMVLGGDLTCSEPKTS